MATVSQEIYKVPGLSGSSWDRRKTLYEDLGSPKGKYTGSEVQNLWLLSQINSGNWGSYKPQAAEATAAPTTNLAQDTANAVGADEVNKGPVFGEVLPYDEAWGGMKPYFQQQAEWEINPEQRRLLNNALKSYSMSLAGTGGGRFGFNDRGSIEAENARNTKAMTQDWLTNQEDAFKKLWYDPAETSYNKALETGTTPTAPTLPTFDAYKQQYGSNWGTPTSSNQYLPSVYGSAMTNWGANNNYRPMSNNGTMPGSRLYTQPNLTNFMSLYNSGFNS